jgi:hypothetical protein
MTTMQWFRVYADAFRCPKLLRLTYKQRWFWVCLLSIYTQNGQKTITKEDLVLCTNLRSKMVGDYLDALVDARLIDKENQGFKPHNWEIRQYKSDNSTERVKRFRNASRNVSETAPEQNRTEAEQNRAEQNRTEQKGRKQDSPPPEGRTSSAPFGANTAASPNGASTVAAADGVNPGPTRTRTGAGPYVFEEGVIRLNQRDLNKICEMYPRLNIRGELTAMAGWAARFGTQWWVPVMNNLAKKEREFRDRAELARVTANATDITRLFPKPPGSW